MKKVLSIMFAIAMVLLPLSLVGCGNKGMYYRSELPAACKVESVYTNNSVAGSHYTKNYTFIQGKYNNYSVVYIREETTWENEDHSDYQYLWIADDTTTSVFDMPKTEAAAKTGHGYSQPVGDTEVSFWFTNVYDAYLSGLFYPEKYITSKNDNQIVYSFKNQDIITVSNDQYHYIVNRTIYYRGNVNCAYSNTVSIGENYVNQIPNISEFFAS